MGLPRGVGCVEFCAIAGRDGASDRAEIGLRTGVDNDTNETLTYRYERHTEDPGSPHGRDRARVSQVRANECGFLTALPMSRRFSLLDSVLDSLADALCADRLAGVGSSARRRWSGARRTARVVRRRRSGRRLPARDCPPFASARPSRRACDTTDAGDQTHECALDRSQGVAVPDRHERRVARTLRLRGSTRRSQPPARDRPMSARAFGGRRRRRRARTTHGRKPATAAGGAGRRHLRLVGATVRRTRRALGRRDPLARVARREHRPRELGARSAALQRLPASVESLCRRPCRQSGAVEAGAQRCNGCCP